MLWLLEFLFGCRHRRETFPQCRRDRRGRPLLDQPSYVACLACGRERAYVLFDPDYVAAGSHQHQQAWRAM